MSSQILQGGNCSAEDLCCDPINTQIPGPVGATGAAGADGTDGVSAFTTLTAGFTMPAEGANVVAAVADSAWMTLGQVLFVQVAGYMQVMALPTALSVTLQNLENTASAIYPGNAAPATAIPNTSKVSPGGVTGPAGTLPLTLPVSIANGGTGGVTAAAARTNLGLGTMAVQNANAVAITGGSVAGITDLAVADGGTGASTAAGARTNLGLGTMAVQAAGAVAITGGSITGITDLAIADGGTGAGTIVAARANLEVLSGYGLIGFLNAVNLNVANNDNALTMLSARYRIDLVTLESPSAAVVAATAGLFTAAGGGGVTLCADQALAATLTATTKVMDLVKQAIVNTDERTEGTLYFRTGTLEGAARTVNLRIFGYAYDLGD